MVAQGPRPHDLLTIGRSAFVNSRTLMLSIQIIASKQTQSHCKFNFVQIMQSLCEADMKRKKEKEEQTLEGALERPWHENGGNNG